MQVCVDSGWEEWDFVKMTDTLKLWTRRNPIDRQSGEDQIARRRDELFNARERQIPFRAHQAVT